MEFLKDYNFQLMYHLGKTNIEVYALNRKITHVFALMEQELKLVKKFKYLNLYVKMDHEHFSCNIFTFDSSFHEIIREK